MSCQSALLSLCYNIIYLAPQTTDSSYSRFLFEFMLIMCKKAKKKKSSRENNGFFFGAGAAAARCARNQVLLNPPRDMINLANATHFIISGTCKKDIKYLHPSSWARGCRLSFFFLISCCNMEFFMAILMKTPKVNSFIDACLRSALLWHIFAIYIVH